MQSQFFLQEGQPFWSVSILYELVGKEENTTRELDDAQNKLFTVLRTWRREKSEKEVIPAYLIATNVHFVQMIKLKCLSLESLKSIKGFGHAKIGKYGKEITEMIKLFYEQP